MQANSEFTRLWSVLEENSTEDHVYEGMAYRYVAERYAHDEEILSGKGAWQFGGRWNGSHAFHAVYCASTATLAHEEYLQGLRLTGLGEYKAMPLVGKAIEVKLQRVLDLREARLMEKLELTHEQLRDDPWRQMMNDQKESLCQCIGRLAYKRNYQGIIVPSSVLTGTEHFNIVVIRENLTRWSIFEVYQEEKSKNARKNACEGEGDVQQKKKKKYKQGTKP